MARTKKKKVGEATLYIRIPDAMYDRISRIAKDARRSIAMQACIFLEGGLEKHDASQQVTQ